MLGSVAFLHEIATADVNDLMIYCSNDDAFFHGLDCSDGAAAVRSLCSSQA